MDTKPRTKTLASHIGGGLRAAATRFVLPLLGIAFLIAAVHWIAGRFGVDMTGQQIARYFWLLLIVGGVGVGIARRK